MWKAKLIKKENGYAWMKDMKIGQIKDVSDSRFLDLKKKGFVEGIEHYRIISTGKQKCETCGHISVKRQKFIIKETYELIPAEEVK